MRTVYVYMTGVYVSCTLTIGVDEALNHAIASIRYPQCNRIKDYVCMTVVYIRCVPPAACKKPRKN
jgi:hypothetical protein